MPKFLVVDYHTESRFLLTKTLLRKFPGANILECDEAESALAHAQEADLSAIITHRTFDTPGLELVQRFREVNPRVPLVMVSGMEREQPAKEAGATAFLHYDEWLRIGSVVEALLPPGSRGADPAPEHSQVA